MWDDLCLISGIRDTRGGPTELFHASSDSDELPEELLEKLLQSLLASPVLPRAQFSEEILRDTLSQLFSKLQDEPLSPSVEPTWKPFPIQDWWGYGVLAIGVFDVNGGAVVEEIEMKPGQSITNHWQRPAGGREAVVRWVRNNDDGWSIFTKMYDEAAGQWVEVTMDVGSRNEFNPNFFVLRGPFHYLEAWVNWDALPPRSVAFPNDPEPMSIAGELYEIVNSRERRENMGGYLHYITYYGALEMYDGQYQDSYEEYFKEAWHLARAIRDGVPGRDLLPALCRDLGVWIACRPDVWPHRPPPSQAWLKPLSATNAESAASTGFDALPTEVLMEILGEIPVPDLVGLTLVCRSLRSLCLDGGLLDAVCRARILTPHAELYWLQPVAACPDEAGAFKRACEAWMPGAAGVDDPAFPAFAFVREAWLHDSMRNRRRLWKIVKQFEEVWRSYRTQGWQNTVFSQGWEDIQYVLDDSDEE